jgi:GAF domain-containing protein
VTKKELADDFFSGVVEAEAKLRSTDQDATEQLFQLSHTLVSTLDKRRILVALSDTLRAIFNGERALIFLGAHRGSLAPAIGRNATPNDLVLPVRYCAALIERAIETQRPEIVQLPREAALFRRDPDVEALALVGMAALPMLLDGELRGLIYVDGSRHFSRTINASLSERLLLFAGHAALAIENATLLGARHALIRPQ